MVHILTPRRTWIGRYLSWKQANFPVANFLVRLLLDKGANANLRNPLFHIAGTGSAGTIELLLSCSAEIDQSDGIQTPLIQAALMFNVEATRKLLRKGPMLTDIIRAVGKFPSVPRYRSEI